MIDSFPAIRRLLEEIEELAKRDQMKEELDTLQYQNGMLLETIQQATRFYPKGPVNVEDLCNHLDQVITLNRQQADEWDRVCQLTENIAALDGYKTLYERVDYMLKKLRQYEPQHPSALNPENQPSAGI